MDLALRRIGIPDLASGPDAAGAGQLVLIAEQAGRHLACAPVVETLAAARLPADGVDRFHVWFTDFAPLETLHRFAEVITAVTTSPTK